MQLPGTPEGWKDWFQAGTIDEVEFFHALTACSKSMDLSQILAVLDEDMQERFRATLRKLVSLEDILGGQAVTSVVRYELSDARRLLERMEE